MQNNHKAWWTLLVMQCTMVALVLGAFVGMKANIVSMKADLRLANLRLQAMEEQLAAHKQTLAQPGVPSSAPGSQAGTAQSADPAADSTGHETTICVNKMTHQVFPCKEANKCLGANNFDGAYFKGIRAKLGIAEDDTMVICDERTVEGASDPNAVRDPGGRGE